jgi:predicted transcriptional regulator
MTQDRPHVEHWSAVDRVEIADGDGVTVEVHDGRMQADAVRGSGDRVQNTPCLGRL